VTHIRAVTVWAGSRILTIVFATFLIFVGLSVAPGDPVRAQLGAHATAAAVAHERAILGLDRPLLVRYWDWLSSAVHGDFGTSLVYKTSVSSLISPRVGTTLLLVTYSLVIILVIGLGLGVAGGAVRGLRTPVAALSGLFAAIPAFVAAQVLVVVFALHLGWFPVSGGGAGFFDQLHHLTLPAVALALGWSAWVAQVTRASVTEAGTREFVDTATGRGIGTGRVFRRHVLRNAAGPIVTVSGLTLAGLFAGAVVVEDAFALNGLGTLLINAVSAKDYSVVLAVSAMFVLIFVLVTSAIDAIHVLLDPRIRRRAVAA
jgi:peptide/nickel transport system permease protein